MINATWDKFLNEEFQKPYFKELSEFLKREYRTKTIYPPKKEVFFIRYLSNPQYSFSAIVIVCTSLFESSPLLQ